ncbi:MAG: hypothetical protein ACYC7E_07000 [Armatimonadota bacterium]
MSRFLLCLIAGLACALVASAAPLATFTVKDSLRHQWTDEIVHFAIPPLALNGLPKSVTLTDADGKPVPCQAGKGTVWSVVTLPPSGQATFHLVAGKPSPSPLRLLSQGRDYLLGNEFIVLRLPRLTGKQDPPVDLVSLPAPLQSVTAPGKGAWYGAGAWVNADVPLQVKEAATTVLEEGPVRVTVRYKLTFTDDRFYQADITLGVRQDAALITEDTNVEAPKAAFRYSFLPGLGADRIYWRNNFYADQMKGLNPGPLSFDKEQRICELRPWSYWWLKDVTVWAGFYKEGADPFVGILALRPSRWTPNDWNGFDRTAIPFTARPGGQLDMTLALLAETRKQTDGTTKLVPLHREWAITVGSAAEHVIKEDGKAKLRQQLIKYSEFPLDEVKDYGFDFTPGKADRAHPFLIFTREDIERVRKQAKTVPAVQKELARATTYLQACGGDNLVKLIESGPDGWKKFYQQNYIGNYLFEVAPIAYLASDEKKYGIILAAGVKGMAQEVMNTFVESPARPDIGDYGPWFTNNWMRLLLAYDAIAGTEYLTAEEKEYIQAVLVFGAHFLAHPDYWNTDVGLCSANPNMTSSIRLPLGLLALYLDGHPKSSAWLKDAEDELKSELQNWIAPGGAWIEDPGYQSASLDGMFLLAQALKNVTGRDYFADSQFKATMEYYGFLLTPPDLRFPPVKKPGDTPPMTVPSIGDMFSGHTTPSNGWIAAATAKSDPEYSARAQFFWKGQNCSYASGGRAAGYLLAVTNPELPAAPPTDLSRPFPGFGSIVRTSWTDPKASYVAHRNGYFIHHYHQEFNEIVYHAKGAPLCTDFGNCYAPVQRWEPYYHSTVSFDLASSARHWGLAGSQDPDALEMRSLPKTIDYSTGRSRAGGNQKNDRYLLMVKSDDPMGANYLVIRDATQDGQPNQEFFWNLWCLSKEPEIAGNVVHFPGQFGVDLDAHVLSPANPQFTTDKWSFKEQIYIYGWFEEIQHGVHVRKAGSTEDFFTVLYPRAAGQGPAGVVSLTNGRGVEVTHMEGKDVVLLSPGRSAMVKSGEVELTGQVAFARLQANGILRLAVVKSAAAVQLPWGLRSDGPTAISIKGTTVEGESSGDAHTAIIALPPTYGTAVVTLDGKPFEARREKSLLTLDLPAGYHTFTIKTK